MDLSFLLEKGNKLVVCPDQVKTGILNWLNASGQLANVRFMNLKQFDSAFFFDWDYRAVAYLAAENPGIKIANARELLENLKYIPEKAFPDDEHLHNLSRIRKELDSHDLLIYDPLFRDYLNKTPVIFYGYGRLDLFHETIARQIGARIIEMPSDRQKEYKIAVFNDVEREIEYLFNSIAELLRQGVSIHDIFIANIGRDYNGYIRRFCHYFNIAVMMDRNENIGGTPIVKQFLSWIGTCNRQQVYENLQAYKDSSLYGTLLGILNRYVCDDLSVYGDIIVDDISNTKMPKPLLDNAINVIDLPALLTEQQHLFIIGFNDQFPVMKRDNGFLNDSQCLRLHLSTSYQLNQLAKDNMVAFLAGVKNLHLSYSLQSSFSQFDISPVSEQLKYHTYTPSVSYSYSERYNRIRYGYQLDDLRKYDLVSEDLPMLHNSYGGGLKEYPPYDNRFTGLNEQQVGSIGRQVLSYSSMDTFYKCAFHYYLDKILCIRDNDSTYISEVGNLFHDVLSKMYEPDFDFQKTVAEIRKNKKVDETSRDSLLTDQLVEKLHDVIELIRRQEEHIHLNGRMMEKEARVKVDENTLFKGFIDKVYYHSDGQKTLVSVVDYKTGKPEIRLKDNQYGLSMQLPSYLYLLKNGGLFPGQNLQYCGFYLQHVLWDSFSRKDGDLQQQKQDFLLMHGISTSDIDRLQNFDDSFDVGIKSSVIKGLSLKKDGGINRPGERFLDDEQMQGLIDNAEEKIIEASKAIRSGEFTINPKYINSKNVSCNYCPFKAICFVRVRDNVYLDGIIEKEEQPDDQMDESAD